MPLSSDEIMDLGAFTEASAVKISGGEAAMMDDLISLRPATSSCVANRHGVLKYM